ncbi:hypothetical protein [Hathewaya massiliensis]|uniref:hypothetical protein n=1 Tax=Hathewaya massiliensis TaxID=1964382 RepID=UPI00163BE0E9|nr:hypothetical protein [Hathewaya massiliensis]
MNNLESQEIKDDASMLVYEFQGTRAGETIKKLLKYTNELEEILIKKPNKENNKDE